MQTATTLSDAHTLEQLQSLEDRIVTAVRLLHQTRQARQEAEAEAARLRGELAARDSELAALRKEREEVRRRVEKLLTQVDSLAEE